MRVLAERNRANYQGHSSQKSELERHMDALARLADRALRNEIEAPMCTLILRSAKSAPALALAQMHETLAGAGVVAKTILAKVEPDQALHSMFAALAALTPDADLEAHVRWAQNPRLMDAHEQAVYGQELCWTGDAVRRDADKRNRLVLFDETPAAVRRGQQAFKALWNASAPVPAHLLDVRAPDGLLSAAASTKDARQRDNVPPIEGWPLERH